MTRLSAGAKLVFSDLIECYRCTGKVEKNAINSETADSNNYSVL
jgi:hypothetical protein